MSKTFTITVEYDDKYDAADVLESIMGNIDIKNYNDIGVIFKIPHWLSAEREDWIEKKVEQKPAWGEEDEKHFFVIEQSLLRPTAYGSKEDRENAIAWLKSIKPYWRPSKELMDNLKDVINFLNSNSILDEEMKTLYNDLKNL